MNRISRAAATAAVVVAVGSSAASAASGVSTAATAAHVSSVTVTGSPAHPVVTIHGSGFGSKPAHDPSCKPGGQDKCGHFTGWDYGTRLYLVKTSSTGFSAGRYRPSIHELDSIGLVIKHYSAHKIVLDLGSGYAKDRKRFGWTLHTGNHVHVHVRGASGSATAHL